MARRSKPGDPEKLRAQLIEAVSALDRFSEERDVRDQVIELIPSFHMMRDLGSSLLGKDSPSSAGKRILYYLKKYVSTVVAGDELMVISGISEYARRIRELRKERGWPIVSGNTVKAMRENAAEEKDLEELKELPEMKPDEYMLISLERDIKAAERWKLANSIRRDDKLSVRDKILRYFRMNVGQAVTGEELMYLAKNQTEWARRTRELRTEYGWPIATRSNGRPDLPVGAYVLERDRQTAVHDRKIKDPVRKAVLLRDKHTCSNEECRWNHDLWNPSDPRHLEVHHIVHHAKGGSNEKENLITICNVCHDEVHRKEKAQP